MSEHRIEIGGILTSGTDSLRGQSISFDPVNYWPSLDLRAIEPLLNKKVRIIIEEVKDDGTPVEPQPNILTLLRGIAEGQRSEG